jgi:FKBP-type peptidyl-prolyl cis-trans isomerase SlyD
MQVSKDKVVAIDYTLTNNQGQVIDSSQGREPLTYLHGKGSIIPGLEKELEGKAAGDSLKVAVRPEEGYGNHDPQMVQSVPKAAFKGIEDIKAGMQFQAQGPGGQTRVVTVTKVENDQVTVDANHPLAGQTLNFDVTIKNIREASPEELSHGHVHGPGGHQH